MVTRAVLVARPRVAAAALVAAVLASAGCEPERGGGAVVVDVRDDQSAIVAVPVCAGDSMRVAGVSEGGGAGGALLHGDLQPLDEPRGFVFEVSAESTVRGRLTSELPVVTARSYHSEVGSLASVGRWTVSTNSWTLGFEWSRLVAEGPGEYWVRSDGSGVVHEIARTEGERAPIDELALTWCAAAAGPLQ